METLKYSFTVNFTFIQYFKMLFELLSKIVPFYIISFLVSLILSITVIDELSIISIITFFIIIFFRLSAYIIIFYCFLCIMSSILRMILAHKITYCFFENKFTVKKSFTKDLEIYYDMVSQLFPLKYSNVIYIKKRGFLWFPKKIFIESPEFETFLFSRIQIKK